MTGRKECLRRVRFGQKRHFAYVSLWRKARYDGSRRQLRRPLS